MIAWKLWLGLPELALWEAVALLLELEPHSLQPAHDGWMAGPGRGPHFDAKSFPSEKKRADFDKALDFAERAATARGPIHLRGGLDAGTSKRTARVSLSDVVGFFASCDWPNIPAPLRELIRADGMTARRDAQGGQARQVDGMQEATEGAEIAHWIEIQPDTVFVHFAELAGAFARAKHPTEDEDLDYSPEYNWAAKEFDEMLCRDVDQGRLRVCDPITGGTHTYPMGRLLKESHVKVSDLRPYAANLGIGIRFAPTEATTQGSEGEMQPQPPSLQSKLKRKVLISNYLRRWQSIERDLKDASTNGLSKAAMVPGEPGWWYEEAAVAWAKARGKLQDASAQAQGFTSTIHRMRG